MKKILVAEDHREVRENIVELLQLAGYQCLWAADGKEAVERALEEVPDLMICDVMMPELDGFGVLKIIGANPKTANMPVIMLTAKTERSDIRRGMSLGAADYITKPFDDVELLQAVELRLRKNEMSNFAGTPLRVPDGGDREAWHKALEAVAEKRHLRRKDVVFEMERSPSHVLFVQSGLLKRSVFNKEGRELIVGFYSSGECCAFEHILGFAGMEFSVTAVEDSSVLFVPYERMLELIGREPLWKSMLFSQVSGGLALLERRLCDTSYDSVRSRVAGVMLEMFASKDGLALHREELAAYIGISKETLIRCLSEFRDDGLISVHDHHIGLIDTAKLRFIHDAC